MSTPHVPADQESPGDPGESYVTSKTAERTGIQVDGYKVKVHVRPAETGEPTPETWGEVARSVNEKLKALAVSSVGLVVDVVEGSRRIVRGLAEIPAAVAHRIDRAHVKADREEAIEQEKAESRAMPPPLPAAAVDRVEEILLRLQAEGTAVEIHELEDGRQAILIVKPEDRQIAAAIAGRALPSPSQSLANEAREEKLKKAREKRREKAKKRAEELRQEKGLE
jgi:hypothetical protein